LSPHRALDRDQIIAATLRLSCTPSANAISYRRIAKELNVDPAALYRHFSAKDELLDASLDRLWQVCLAPLDLTLPWRDRLRRGAWLIYEAAVSHPALGVEASYRSTGGPGEQWAILQILSALEDAGLRGQDVVRSYAVYAGTVLSMAGAQSAYRIAEEAATLGYEDPWVAGSLDLEADEAGADLPDVLARYGQSISQMTNRETFELMLDAILDAVETSASSPRKATTSASRQTARRSAR